MKKGLIAAYGVVLILVAWPLIQKGLGKGDEGGSPGSGSSLLGSAASGSDGAAAEARVEAMLKNTPPNGDEQTAVCQWAKGVNFIPDRDAIDKASLEFDVFRKDGGIWEVREYEISGSEPTSSGGKDAVVVSCKIDGQNLRMVVAAGEPIQWK